MRSSDVGVEDGEECAADLSLEHHNAKEGHNMQQATLGGKIEHD